MPVPDLTQQPAENVEPGPVAPPPSPSPSRPDLTPHSLAAGAGDLVRRLGGGQLSRYSGVYVWGLFILIFALWVPHTFLTTTTVTSIAGNQAITMIVAVGLLFSFATGQFDLSAAQNVGLSAVVCGALIAKAHVAWPLAIVFTLLIGTGIGVVNGGLVLLGVDSFIATLGMSSILLAFTELTSGDNYIGPLPTSFQAIATNSIAGIPLVTIYAFGLALIVWYVLEHTPIGRRAYATGANPDAARLAGVRTRRHVFVSLVATASVAALAGVLVAARIGEVSPSLGPPYLLPVFAACFLGTTQIKVGRFNVWGTVLAIFLLATGVEGLQLAGGALWVTDMFNGVALVGAVSIAVLGAKRRSARGRDRAARA